MSFASDDLLSVLVPEKDRSALRFGQGKVLEFNPLDGSNRIEYHGAVLTNLSILNTNEAVLLKPGSVVGILAWRTSYFIIGRITIPNTPEAATALDMVRIFSDNVADLVFTSSATFVDLGGPTVRDVLVSKSGRAMVFMTAHMSYGFSGALSAGGMVSLKVTGATSINPDDTPAQVLATNIGSNIVGQEAISGQIRATAVRVIEGLNPGLHTITMWYSRLGSEQVSFYDRNLTVIPF